jgi:glutamine amidotransferase
MERNSDKKKNNLFININNKVDFYFAHSYVLQCKNKSDVVSTTNYGQNFASSINRENIFGVQFHPEKSLKNGIQLLKNFLDYEKN